MIVQRYLGSHLLETIRNSEFKVSKISEFNDPFEFRYRHTGEYKRSDAKRDLRERLRSPAFLRDLRTSPRFKDKSKKEIKKTLYKEKERVYGELIEATPKGHIELIEDTQKHADQTSRVLCFSTPTENKQYEILRWSHYAQSHSGSRITINLSTQEAPLSKPFMVNYKDDLVAAEHSKMSHPNYFDDKLKEAMLVKAKCWTYEEEVRTFFPKPLFKTKEINGVDLDFFPINLQGIKRIDFGVKFPKDQVPEVIEAFSEYPTVDFFQASCSKSNFEIEYEKI